MEAEQKIWQYLVGEKECTESIANMILDKIVKYEDIKQEFLHWLEKRDYIVEEPVIVEGYSALAIVDRMATLDGVGAFSMLVDLRDRPKEAREILQNGLAIL